MDPGALSAELMSGTKGPNGEITLYMPRSIYGEDSEPKSAGHRLPSVLRGVLFSVYYEEASDRSIHSESHGGQLPSVTS